MGRRGETIEGHPELEKQVGLESPGVMATNNKRVRVSLCCTVNKHCLTQLKSRAANAILETTTRRRGQPVGWEPFHTVESLGGGGGIVAWTSC